jgi:hypothetical protein
MEPMSARKPSSRTLRRAHARAVEKLADAREKLARLEPGGAPEHPLAIESASLVEVHARSLRCLRCDGPYRLGEHAADTFDGVRLRVAEVVCTACGTERSVFFQIVAPQMN